MGATPRSRFGGGGASFFYFSAFLPLSFQVLNLLQEGHVNPRPRHRYDSTGLPPSRRISEIN